MKRFNATAVPVRFAGAAHICFGAAFRRSASMVVAAGALVVGPVGVLASGPVGVLALGPTSGEAATSPGNTAVHTLAVRTRHVTPNDSALDELRAGRAWHAARILRNAGAARGGPSDVLLLARAESGWKNHAAVIDLLAGVPWLATESGGAGFALLGRAYEAQERWDDAATAYASYLTAEAARTDAFGAAFRVRRIRTTARAERFDESLVHLDSLAGTSGSVLRSWTALELASPRISRGDTAAVRRLLDRVDEPRARASAWRASADAFTEAGDRVRAAEAWRVAREANTGARRALAGVEYGLLLMSRGDSSVANIMLAASLDEAPRGAASRAAAALLTSTAPDLPRTLELAAIIERGGDTSQALRAYDRAARLASGPAGLSGSDRLTRARLIASTSGRHDEAVEEFRALQETEDARLGARNLEIWAGLRSRQGRESQVETLRDWLLERYPESPEAAEVMWRRAWDVEEGGSLGRASEQYATLIARAGSHNRAGQARMRLGQIHLREGRVAEAADVFEAYLADFPNGQRWEEAAYWAASSRLRLSQPESAAPHLERLRRDEPFSYYAVVAADLTGGRYELDAPTAAPPETAEWLSEGLRTLDLLLAADLDNGVEAVEEELIERAASSPALTLTLAEALIERGRTIPGINLGWALRRDGHAWDGRLLRVVYPLPHREMLTREAAEWGVDPLVLAALIRQESAFTAGIRSSAGALGLMQVMPATGAELASKHGPDGFQTAALTTPEVNLHLGTAFFLEMSGRFESLPLVLSAYNAGPTRANRWQRFEEAADWLRFTERVPYAETRGYIKNVTRNLGIYRILYGPIL